MSPTPHFHSIQEISNKLDKIENQPAPKTKKELRARLRQLLDIKKEIKDQQEQLIEFYNENVMSK